MLVFNDVLRMPETLSPDVASYLVNGGAITRRESGGVMRRIQLFRKAGEIPRLMITASWQEAEGDVREKPESAGFGGPAPARRAA